MEVGARRMSHYDEDPTVKPNSMVADPCPMHPAYSYHKCPGIHSWQAAADLNALEAERRAENAIERAGDFSSVTIDDEALEAMRERVSAKGRR